MTKIGRGLRVVRRGGTALAAVVTLLGLAVGMADLAQAGPLSLASAINKAGRQRMLSQRIVSTYVQVGLSVNPEVAQQRLDEAVALFDSQLGELEAFAPNRRVREAVADVRSLWGPIREIASKPAHREGAKKLLYQSEDLLYASNKVVQLIQDVAGTPIARLVNISGRQRMLSQRMAKYYMALEWGFDTLTIRDEMDRARNEFAGALQRLQAVDENTEAINQELGEVELQWTWFSNALDLQGAQVYRLVVSDSSESILTGMDRVTGLYQELSERSE